MPDELDLDNLDKTIEQDSKVEKRIKDLSEKVRLTSEERDERDGLIKEKDTEIETLKTERDFLSDFGNATQKYPDAVTFREEILEKVKKGYSVDDATVSVLNEQGKLFKAETTETPETPATPEVKTEQAPAPASPAGGSAVTPPPATGSKAVADMTQEERREALVEAEDRGDLGIE